VQRLDWIHLAQAGTVAGSSDHGYETSGSINAGNLTS
jgi:hypothetical protein